MTKFFVTTPIYYVNDLPHIGHTYSTTVADVLARWHRLRGEDVHFVTGTDENAQKNAEVALQKIKKSPARNATHSVAGGQNQKITNEREVIQKYVDEMSAKWRETWDSLGFSHDDFIRTTEERHVKAALKFWENVAAKGDIYKDKYIGLYCVGCEAYVKESDLVNGKCPHHQKEPKKLEEENYFFRASKYKDALLKHIVAHPEFVQPASRRNEIINYIREHFGDFSISRQSQQWGIPVPGDETQVIYVWFDALLNYLTTIGYGSDEMKFKKFWPADLHIVGKDIIKFHCAYWPAMLLSAGLPLPKTVFAHGFFTLNGQKISKSLGNTIDPVELAKTFGVDAVRYFLLREIPFGEDGDFSYERLQERYEGDLANGVGNFAARVVTLAAKSAELGVLNSECTLRTRADSTWTAYEKALSEYRFHDALAAVWEYIAACDKRVNETEPWKLLKTDPKKAAVVLGELCEALRHIAWWLWPILPTTTERIFEQLGILEESRKQPLEEAKKWGGVTIVPKKGEVLFPRLELPNSPKS